MLSTGVPAPGRSWVGLLAGRGFRLLTWLPAVILFVVPLGASVLEVLARAGSGTPLDWVFEPGLWGRVRFTLFQALASTALAVTLGLPGAWVVANWDFRGKGTYSLLGSLPFVVPSLLFVLGYVGVWGNAGWMNSLIRLLAGPTAPGLKMAYSMEAIIVAHGLYNFPLVSSLVGLVWRQASPNPAHAARLLGARPLEAWRTGILPQLLPGLGAAAGLIFLYCFMSFTIPLTLGGGPRYATLEVSIHLALNVERNYPKAGLLGLAELVIAGGVVALYTRLNRSGPPSWLGGRKELPQLRTAGFWTRMVVRLWVGVSSFLALSPLVALVGGAFVGDARPGAIPVLTLDNFAKVIDRPEFALALVNALLVGGASTVLVLTLALLMVLGERGTRNPGLRMVVGSAPLALSPVVLSLGYVLVFRRSAGVAALVAVEATLALPLVYRTLKAGIDRLSPSLHHAASLLGAGPWRQFVDIDLKVLRPAIGLSLALSMAISLGDVNIPLILGLSDVPLPGLQAYRLMGAYRFGQASAQGLVIFVVAGLVIWLSRRLERGEADRVPGGE